MLRLPFCDFLARGGFYPRRAIPGRLDKPVRTDIWTHHRRRCIYQPFSFQKRVVLDFFLQFAGFIRFINYQHKGFVSVLRVDDAVMFIVHTFALLHIKYGLSHPKGYPPKRYTAARKVLYIMWLAKRYYPILDL